MLKGKGTVAKVRVVQHPGSFDIFCNLRLSKFRQRDSQNKTKQNTVIVLPESFPFP